MVGSGWVVPAPAGAQVPSASAAPACHLSVRGRVLDHETAQPLPGATLVVLRADGTATGLATTTDAAGQYLLPPLCAGSYRIRFLFVGYAEETADVRLTRALVLDAALHPDAVQLQSALVRGTRVAAPVAQANAALSAADQRSTRGQTLGEALTRLNGVTAIQTGPSIYKPMIHGLHSNRITVLNNGVRQEGQQWGQEHGPEIDPFVASELSVVKGAATVRYGSDAIGGVVLLKPAPLRDSAGIGGVVHLVGASTNRMGAVSATLDGNARRWPALRARVQGTVRRAGTTRTPDYYLRNSAFAEASYSAAVGWQRARWGVEVFGSRFATRLGILSASHVGNLTDLRRAFAAAQPLETGGFAYAIGRPYQQVSHNLLKTTAHWQPAAGGSKVELTLAHQTDLRDEYDKFPPRNDVRAALNQPELSYQNRTTTADLTWDHPRWAGGAVTGTAGLSATRQANTFDGRYFIPYYTNQVGGAFLIERWLRGRWLFEAGARLDARRLLVKRSVGTAADYRVQRDTFRYLTPALNGGVVFDANPHLTTRLNATLSQRAPAPNERFSQGVHNGQYEEGHDLRLAPHEAALRPETARAVSATATWHSNPRLNGELTAYATRIGGYIYSTPILPPVLTIRGPFPSYRFLQTDARLVGLDAAATYAVAPRWEVAGKVAIVRARDTRRAEPLIFIPPDQAELAVRRTFGAAAGGPQRVTGTYAQLSAQAVARQTRVPRNYDSLDYQQPPAAYWLLGAEMGTTLTVFHHALDLSVAGTNLLNRRYRSYLNRFRYFADEQGRNVTVRVSARL